MWRNSAKLLSNPNYYHHGSLPSSIFNTASPQLLSRCTSSSSAVTSSASATAISAADSPSECLNSRFLSSKSNGIKFFSASSSIAAADLSSVNSALHLVRRYGRCYWELSKARLSMLVVATSGTGYVLGSGNTVDFVGLFWTCAGTMMVAASANTLNQVFEINNDAKMKRTRLRPLPSGRITQSHALTWASSIGLAGTALLACKANLLAAGLGAYNLILYAFIYTPLKQIHPVNTWVGAVVGAIPPLLGWVAASGNFSLNSVILPAALYFWQIPHFMALAYLCRDDYIAGGYKMLSFADTSGLRTASVTLRNCLYLFPLGFLAYEWGLTSGWFCLESSLLTLAITTSAYSFYRDRTIPKARKMFHASLLYLPVFMSGLLLHRRFDNKQGLEEETHLMSASEAVQVDSGNENKKCKERHTINDPQVRPPVSYASAAPFPFLPAPSYAHP